MEIFDAVLFDLFGTLVTDRGEAIAGAGELLAAMPPGRWAIVTSCPRGLAGALIRRASLPDPPVIVSSDDVSRSKPAPDCYLLAAARLEVAPERCLVVEDSRQGVAAGVAAGMTVIAVAQGRSFALERGDVRVIAALRDLNLDLDANGAIALR
ncbi:MAG TPA: HAD-IA family hydrolase [Candidatus Baltobacteraceae bacterium]|nr:HAD-IA family hydrolase [Candidatus Baltobacteraceae bacterium]